MWKKVDVSKYICDGERELSFKMKEESKVSCVKIFLWTIVAWKVLIYYSFYIFEYDAEYGAECSAESGTK